MTSRPTKLIALTLLGALFAFASGGAGWLHDLTAHADPPACTDCHPADPAPGSPGNPKNPGTPGDGHERANECPVCQLIVQVGQHQLASAPTARVLSPCCATITSVPGRTVVTRTPLRLAARAPPAS